MTSKVFISAMVAGVQRVSHCLPPPPEFFHLPYLEVCVTFLLFFSFAICLRSERIGERLAGILSALQSAFETGLRSWTQKFFCPLTLKPKNKTKCFRVRVSDSRCLKICARNTDRNIFNCHSSVSHQSQKHFKKIKYMYHVWNITFQQLVWQNSLG